MEFATNKYFLNQEPTAQPRAQPTHNIIYTPNAGAKLNYETLKHAKVICLK